MLDIERAKKENTRKLSDSMFYSLLDVFEIVNEFVYLGYVISSSRGCEVD